MTRALLFFSLFLFAGGILQSQVNLGFKSGFVTAWQDYGKDVILPVDAEVEVYGFHAHLMAYRPFNKHVSLGFEPGYMERGAACIPGFQSGPEPTYGRQAPNL